MILRVNREVIDEFIKIVVVAGVVCLALNLFGDDYIRSKINFGFLFLNLFNLFIICLIFFSNIWDEFE